MLRLALDAAAVEAIEALRADGIRAILLKGPAIAQWLYDQPWERDYNDIDLLVAPEDHSRAGAILGGLGYRCNWLREQRGIAHHASVWTRRGLHPAEVDLHWQVPLAGNGSGTWSVLSTETEAMSIANTTIEALAPSARALWTVVHAVQHGARSGKAMNDLERVLERADAETWSHAAELSRRLGVEGTFAVGLGLLPAGAELAGRLSVAGSASVEDHLRSVTPSATSIGWLRLLEQRSTRARLRLLAAEILPSPEFMRRYSPMARQGRCGLLLAYLWRPLWLLQRLPAALLDVARARRSARR